MHRKKKNTDINGTPCFSVPEKGLKNIKEKVIIKISFAYILIKFPTH